MKQQVPKPSRQCQQLVERFLLWISIYVPYIDGALPCENVDVLYVACVCLGITLTVLVDDRGLGNTN